METLPFSSSIILPPSFPHSHPRRSLSLSSRHRRLSITPPSAKPLSDRWDHLTLTPSLAHLPRLEDLDSHDTCLRQRIVFIGTPIDTTVADLVISQLFLLDAEDQEKDIKLFIHSPGGATYDGMGIYDAMKLCKADVSTVCFGLAASMAALLLASGTKGKRYIMPNARVMLHHANGYVDGPLPERNIRRKELLYQKEKTVKMLSRITGKSEEQIRLDTREDNFMDAWEAKEYGLVDHVIDDGKPGLIAPRVDSSPPPKPQMYDWWKAHKGVDDDSSPREKRPKQAKKEERAKEEPAPL